MDTVVDKALRVLDVLESGNQNGRPLTEIANILQLPKSTVHRLLATLQRHGYVQRSQSGGYALGTRVIALGQFAAANNNLLTIGRPILDRLVASCAETVQLAVLQGDSLFYIDRKEPEDAAVRLAALPSPMTSLHASASGKVLLAFADEALIDKVLGSELPHYTPHTISDPEQMRGELARIRAQGYAVNEQERFVGVRAVGVPVRDAQGRAVVAISAAGPIQRVDEPKLEQMKRELLTAAADFSAVLG